MKPGWFAVAMLAGAACAAPALAHEFVLYFKLGSAELGEGPSDPLWDVIRDAACYAKGPSYADVIVVGHADTAGSRGYNAVLSRQRAQAVADALVREGVDPKKIRVEGRGEDQPAVATGDGVVEPLSRRVTIQHSGWTGGDGPKCEGPTLPKFPQPSG